MLQPAHANAAPILFDAVWTDLARGRCAVPVRFRMPADSRRSPVSLFSHGLGGNLDAGADWAAAWVETGFITVNIPYAGSGSAIWKGSGRLMQSLRAAMS